ncbi:hypothetical protein [Actinomadura sp. 9N215]|uniref:hypothetical protein n=1 Tax=Actinomadura sp. 9N215 TaxID=3375150 RepID=UPI00379D3BEF
MAEQQASGPHGALWVLDALAERAKDASSRVVGGAAGLTLSETAVALEHVTRALEDLHTVVGSLNGRVGQIQEGEMTERRGDAGLGVSGVTALMRLDDATVHLDHGGGALSAAHHLVGLGLGVLVQVERGEC